MSKLSQFICLVDYYATGEGSTKFLKVGPATSLEEFKEKCCKSLDAYFISGAEFFENEYPPERYHSLIAFLASPSIINFMKDSSQCYFSYEAKCHISFS